jgi:hypothetical protein
MNANTNIKYETALTVKSIVNDFEQGNKEQNII